MIAYPAISPLTGDRHALHQLIGMAGLGDRHHPDSLIEITGMRTSMHFYDSLKIEAAVPRRSHMRSSLLHSGYS